MNNKIRKIEVTFRQIVWACKQSFKPTTYDSVNYYGNKYYIKSSLVGEDVWDLYRFCEKLPTHRRIKGNEFKLVHSVGRFIYVFKSNYKFQKMNWYSIDCQNSIGTRLSYKNSDNIYFSKSS